MAMLLQLGWKHPEDWIDLFSVVGHRCDPSVNHVSRNTQSSISRLYSSRLPSGKLYKGSDIILFV